MWPDQIPRFSIPDPGASSPRQWDGLTRFANRRGLGIVSRPPGSPDCCNATWHGTCPRSGLPDPSYTCRKGPTLSSEFSLQKILTRECSTTCQSLYNWNRGEELGDSSRARQTGFPPRTPGHRFPDALSKPSTLHSTRSLYTCPRYTANTRATGSFTGLVFSVRRSCASLWSFFATRV